MSLFLSSPLSPSNLLPVVPPPPPRLGPVALVVAPRSPLFGSVIDVALAVNDVVAWTHGDKAVQMALRAKCPRIPLAVVGNIINITILLHHGHKMQPVHFLSVLRHSHDLSDGPKFKQVE